MYTDVVVNGGESANAQAMSSLPFLMTAMPVGRILALGARRVDIGRGKDVSWVVLADPEGHNFCVLRSVHG